MQCGHLLTGLASKRQHISHLGVMPQYPSPPDQRDKVNQVVYQRL